MSELWHQSLHRFDSSQQLHQGDRLRTLIKGQASDYANSVHESGHTFAVMHSASQYGAVDQMSENLFGLTQVNRMQEIARLEDFDDIAKKLGQIAEHVLKKTSIRSVDRSSYARASVHRDMFLQIFVQWRIERIDAWCEAIGNLSRSSSGFISRPIESHPAREFPGGSQERFSNRQETVEIEDTLRNALRRILFGSMLSGRALLPRG